MDDMEMNTSLNEKTILFWDIHDWNVLKVYKVSVDA